MQRHLFSDHNKPTGTVFERIFARLRRIGLLTLSFMAFLNPFASRDFTRLPGGKMAADDSAAARARTNSWNNNMAGKLRWFQNKYVSG